MQPGWAEIMVPIQGIDTSKIILEAPQKVTRPGIPTYAQDRPLSALTYNDGFIQLPCLAVLTPFLKVLSWDSSTGRLDLHVVSGTQTYQKLTLIQNYMLNMIHDHQKSWIGTMDSSTQEIRDMYQPMLVGERLTIYLHGANPEQKTTGRVWLWASKGWQKGASKGSFKPGDMIRVAIRLQGICYLIQGARVRFRLQHQTIAIYKRGA